jgi:hypothetical protein
LEVTASVKKPFNMFMVSSNTSMAAILFSDE